MSDTEEKEVESYITFYPYTNVKSIKITGDNGTDIEKAIAAKNKMKLNTVLLTRFSEGQIQASYFATDDEDKSIFTIYKKTPYQQYYQYVCTLDEEYKLTDYNIEGNQFYNYLISVEFPVSGGKSEYLIYKNTDDSGVDNYYKVKFDAWTICDIEKTTEDNIYQKTGRMWELGLNLEGEELTHNSSVTTWDTLGKYPKFSIGQRSYKSMTFTSLLGKMKEYTNYTYENEDGISTATAHPNTYSYTEKLETYTNADVDVAETEQDERWNVWRKYARENEKLVAWNTFITNGSLKLLRDIKGNAWIIQIADSTTSKINTVSMNQETTVSFQWKEAEDISNKSIIVMGDNTEV